MMQKYQILSLNKLLQLVTINLPKILLVIAIKSKILVDKSAISGFINNADLDNKVATLATKAELKAEQDKIIKLQVFDSIYFRGKSHFVDDDSTQKYLLFQSIYSYFKRIGNTSHITSWNSKELPDKVIKLLN